MLPRPYSLALSSLVLLACRPSTPASESPTTAGTAEVLAEDTPLQRMTLDPRPDWADKYAGSNPDERFLKIDALMEDHGLDRARAVEVQNHFRDLTRQDPQGDREAQFAEALQRGKDGVFEDDRDLEALAQAPFIVVFDLDETLYDQYIRDETLAKSCHDFIADHPGGETKYVKLTPGWASAFHRIQALGGTVVLFSANLDDRCWANAARWMLDGVTIDQHPVVAGFMSNSHLVLQPKEAGDPVVEPSKDLRILDESLERAIIVDDNPTRLFQFRNVRVYKKFQADEYCRPDLPNDAKLAYGAGLEVVVDEIEDALKYHQAHPDKTFAQAYLPYTVLGSLAVRWLRHDTGRSQSEAIDYLREHPELADDDF